MMLSRGKAIVIAFRSKRFKRLIVSDLIKRGITPYGVDFFAKIDLDEEERLLIKPGEMRFASQKEIDEEERLGTIVAYFPHAGTARSMLRYIALTPQERDRMLRASEAALRTLNGSVGETFADPLEPKIHKA